MTSSPPVRAHVLRFGLLAAWCCVVWYLSGKSRPGDTIGWLIELPDWLLHGAEYAVGGFLAHQAAAPLVGRRAALVALVFGVCWGVLDEFHQSFVPGREVAVGDVVADTIGTLIGIAAHLWWTRRRAP